MVAFPRKLEKSEYYRIGQMEKLDAKDSERGEGGRERRWRRRKARMREGGRAAAAYLHRGLPVIIFASGSSLPSRV